jgi:hypothetical protein
MCRPRTIASLHIMQSLILKASLQYVKALFGKARNRRLLTGGLIWLRSLTPKRRAIMRTVLTKAPQRRRLWETDWRVNKSGVAVIDTSIRRLLPQCGEMFGRLRRVNDSPRGRHHGPSRQNWACLGTHSSLRESP